MNQTFDESRIFAGKVSVLLQMICAMERKCGIHEALNGGALLCGISYATSSKLRTNLRPQLRRRADE